MRCKTNIYRNALIPIILHIHSQFVSYSRQHCFSFMLQYFSMEKRVARNSRRKRSWSLIFFSLFFQKVKRGFQFFNMFPLTNILQKYVFRERHFWGKTFFKIATKNHWRMKFNFLIKNITSNFTKYGTPIARSRPRRCSVKKVFLKISQLSQEHLDAGVFL